MNYLKHYNAITARGKKLSWEGERQHAPHWSNRDGEYREGHRVLPGCLGGKYISDNVVYLPPEYHYVAHQLLIKIYPDTSKLVFAAKMMTVANSGQVRNHKLYGWLKRKMGKEMSLRHKGKHLSPATEIKKGQRLSPKTEFKKGQVGISAGKIRITDGGNNRLHNPNLPIPSGWWQGMTKQGYTNNGKTGKWHRTEAYKKIFARNGKKICIERNPMASEENRNKVAASKVGRKRIYNADGSFTMTPRVS